MNKKIDESLNMEPIDDLEEVETEDGVTVYEETQPKPPAIRDTKKDELDKDLEFVRKNMYDLIEKGSLALNDLEDIANQTQQARAYEVFSGLMKSLMDANKDLVELSQKKNEEKEEEKQQVNNNHLYVGSTADLLRIMKKQEDTNE